ncbi:MAG: hypothetical protein IKU70_10220 [Clostridia bacterium]|nr:hypothetical protein [Clostridia bacterium]
MIILLSVRHDLYGFSHINGMKSMKIEKTLDSFESSVFLVVLTGLEPVVSLTLGQVRNSRLLSLPLGMLLCSPRFRLASSATGGASAPRPSDVPQAHRWDTLIPYRSNKYQKENHP